MMVGSSDLLQLNLFIVPFEKLSDERSPLIGLKRRSDGRRMMNANAMADPVGVFEAPNSCLAAERGVV